MGWRMAADGLVGWRGREKKASYPREDQQCLPSRTVETAFILLMSKAGTSANKRARLVVVPAVAWKPWSYQPMNRGFSSQVTHFGLSTLAI